MKYKGKTLQQRFFDIAQPGPGNECWPWPGGKTAAGYGTIGFNWDTFYVHRLSYQWYIGPIPDGYYVCHRCDNPSCWNPNHLFVGSGADNMKDCASKQRQSGRVRQRISLMDREYIRGLSRDEYNLRRLSARFGVTEGTISKIRCGTAKYRRT